MIRPLVGLAILAPSFLIPYFASDIFPFWYGTIGVILACVVFFGRDWWRKAGLQIGWRDALAALVLATIAYQSAIQIIPFAIAAYGQNYQFTGIEGWDFRALQFFQVLNEEIVLRALLLWACLRLLPRISPRLQRPWPLALAAAFVFSFSHMVIYRITSEPTIWLAPMTLLNLFLFALICNWSYLIFGHIAYALALHAGWNLYRFSGDLYDWQHFKIVDEAETFNVLEASPLVTGLVALSLALVITLKMFNQRRSNAA